MLSSRGAVAKQRLEPVIHVLLDVAMEQRKSWLIRGKIHNGAAVVRHHHRILNNSGSLLAVDFD